MSRRPKRKKTYKAQTYSLTRATLSQLSTLFGARVAWQISKGIVIPARIQTFKLGYQSVSYLVKPENGIGSAWVPSGKLKLITSRWPNVAGPAVKDDDNAAQIDKPRLDAPTEPILCHGRVDQRAVTEAPETGDARIGAGNDDGDISGWPKLLHLPHGLSVQISDDAGAEPGDLCTNGEAADCRQRERDFAGALCDGVYDDADTAELLALFGNDQALGRQPAGSSEA